VKSKVIELVSILGATDSYTSGTRDMHSVWIDFGIAVSNFVVEVDADENGTIEVDESTDQIVWEPSGDVTDYVGDSGVLALSVMPVSRYVRAKFVNGSSGQTRFTMTTGVDYQ
jgi:hypothetical protein